ncbi:MAG: leucine-rich repeat protein, partial [Mycoplasma sp.]|nr:leucine-rich repeat protein [Candidatus Hennigella equi]
MKLKKILIPTLATTATLAGTVATLASCGSTPSTEWSKYFVKPSDAEMAKEGESVTFSLELKNPLADGEKLSVEIVDQTTTAGYKVKTDGEVEYKAEENKAYFTINLEKLTSTNSMVESSFSLRFSCTNEQGELWTSEELKGFSIKNEFADIVPVFNVSEGELKGLTSEFIEADEDLQKASLVAAFGSEDSFVIPADVTSIAASAFISKESQDSSSIPSFVTGLTFAPNSTCVSIGQKAFQYAPFTTIVIPSSVTTIGSNAFANCSNLNNIDIRDTFSIPTTWASGCFNYSASSGNIDVMGEWYVQKAKTWFNKGDNWDVTPHTSMFQFDQETPTVLQGFNKQLTQAQIAEICQDLGGKLTIPEKVTKIQNWAFYASQETTIPNTIKELVFAGDKCVQISDWAFAKAPFTKITLPASLVEFGASCFANLPNITEIDATAFTKRPAAAQDSIWKGVQTTVNGNIYVADDQASITDTNTAGYWFYNSGFKTAVDKKQWSISIAPLFNIEEGVLTGFNPDLSEEQILARIENNTLTIPANVTKIADRAFFKYPDSTIPASVTTLKFAGDVCAEVEDHAFRKAPFTNVTLPASLKTFGSNCFDEMPNLNDIDATAYEGRPAAASTEIWGTTHATTGIIHVAEGQGSTTDISKVG